MGKFTPAPSWWVYFNMKTFVQRNSKAYQLTQLYEAKVSISENGNMISLLRVQFFNKGKSSAK